MGDRPSADLGLVLADGAQLTLADLLPGGAAQRAGLRRGQRVLTINGQSCAELRRVEAEALLDYRVGAANDLSVQDLDGRPATVPVRGDPSLPISARILPGPYGLLRVDGFAAPTRTRPRSARHSPTSRRLGRAAGSSTCAGAAAASRSA